MEFTSADRVIVAEMLKHGEVSFYELHQKYHLSPAQIADSVSRLESLAIIDAASVSKDVFKIAENGHSLLISYRKHLLFRSKPWKKVPEYMIAPAIPVNSAYFPAFKKMGKSIRIRQRQLRKEMRDREHAG